VLSLNLLVVIGSAGIALSFVCLLALHLLSTPVHPIRDAICDHASYRFGFLFRLHCAAIGMSGVCLLILLIRLGYTGSSFGLIAHLGVIALIVFTLARIAIILFPSDIKPPRTPRGSIHIVLDIFLFIGISFASGFLNYFFIHTRFSGVMPWAGMSAMLWITAVLTELCAMLTIFTVSVPAFRKLMGLNERILYLGILLWFSAVFMPMVPLL
jgi:hypothetical protein